MRPPSSIPPAQIRTEAPKRRVVFVDPDDSSTAFWWPAIVVPKQEITIFSRFVEGEVPIPGNGEFLVCYFEDGSFSIVPEADTLPFNPTKPPYLTYLLCPDADVFRQDKGIQYATAYWNDGMIPPAFRWLNEFYDADEAVNVNLFPLRDHIEALKKRRIDAVRHAVERKKQRAEVLHPVEEVMVPEKMELDTPLKDVESFDDGDETSFLQMVIPEVAKILEKEEITDDLNEDVADVLSIPEADALQQFIGVVMQHEHTPETEIQDTAARTETPFSESIDEEHPSSDTNEESAALLTAVLNRIEQEGKAEKKNEDVKVQEEDFEVKMEEEVSPASILFEAIMQEEAKSAAVEEERKDEDVSMEEAPMPISPETENAAEELLEAVITRMECDLESMTIAQPGNNEEPKPEDTQELASKEPEAERTEEAESSVQETTTS